MPHTPQLSRKHSSFNDDNKEEEFRAAFITITNNSSDKLKSKVQLLKALQCCGRNPNSKKVDSYWERYSKTGIGFGEFCEIAEKEEELSEKQLIKAFKHIDVNNDGFISFDELYNMLTNKGDKMSKEEVREILDQADGNRDGKLDYYEFTRLIMDTVDTTKSIAKKQMKVLTKTDEPERGKKSRETSRSRSPPLTSRSKSPLSARSNKSGRDDSMEDLREGAGSRSSNRSLLIKKSENLNSSRSKILSRNSDEEENSSRQRKKSDRDNTIDIKIDAPIKAQDSVQIPKNLKRWKRGDTKGAFFINDKSNSIFTNSFALELREDSKVFFEVEPYGTSLHKNTNFLAMDVMLLIVQEKNKARRLKAVAENRIENKWCITCDLKAGRYFIFPYTSGTFLRKRKSDDHHSSSNILVTKDSKGRLKLSEKYNEALNVIFDIFDLDSNNRFNKQELELYTSLSEGENLDNDGWRTIEEQVGFEKNELTREGFIKLSKIEITREDVDFKDIWTRLGQLGFNKNLELDQCCPYNLKVFSENPVGDFIIRADELTKLTSVEPFFHEHVQSKGTPVNLSVKGLRDVGLIEYHNSFLTAFMIENNKDTDIRLKLSDDGSENCLFSQSINDEILVKPHRKKTALFVQAKNEKKSWRIRLNASD